MLQQIVIRSEELLPVKTSGIEASANRIITGYESMNMIRKGQHLALSRGQIKNVKQDDISSQIRFIHSLFGIAV